MYEGKYHYSKMVYHMSSETEDDGGVVKMDSVEESNVSDEIEDGEWPILTMDESRDYTSRVVRPRQEFVEWSMVGKSCHLW